MKRIWLVRHGESTAQARREHDTDPGLSDRGTEQARRLRERLAGLHFDAIWLSPLRRARRTFELADLDAAELAFDSRLIECAFDVRYDRLLPYATPSFAAADRHDAWRWPTSRRAASVLASLREAASADILLIGHWGMFSILLMQLAGHSSPAELVKGEIRFSAPMANAALSVLVHGDPKYGDCILSWNDHAHVADLLDGPLQW